MNVDFTFASTNGKGYTVYLSKDDKEGQYMNYSNVNYNAKGVCIKGLSNGGTYYIFIEYKDVNGVVTRSEVVELKLSKVECMQALD